MKPLVRRSLWTLLASIVLVFVVILLGILPIRANFLKAPVAAAVRDAAGLELSIGGPVEVRLGLTPAVTSSEVALGSPGEDRLLEIGSLHARISLMALFRSRIHVRELKSDGIRIDYCAPLPVFPDKPEQDSEPPSIVVDGIDLTGISIHCGRPMDSDPLAIDVAVLSASAPLENSVQLSTEGSISTLEFGLSATGGDLNELMTGSAQFPLVVRLESADTVLELEGNLQLDSGGPVAAAGFDIDIKDLRPIAAAFDVELAEFGELSAQGKLRLERSAINLGAFAGNLGESDFAIDASINVARERPQITLNASSNRLDLEPLLAGEPETATGGAADADFGPFLDALGMFDATIGVSISELLGTPLDVTAIEIDAQVLDGNAVLRSLDADLLGGRWSIAGDLDSRAECPEFGLLATGTGIDLATLNPLLATERRLGGTTGAISLESGSCGGSFLAHRDTLRANVDIASIEARLDDEPLPLSVKDLRAATEPGERGRATLVGKLLGEKVEATAAVGSLEALLGSDPWPLDLDVRGGGSRLIVDGRARLVPEQMLVDARARLHTPRLGSLHAWTGVATDAGLPLSAETRLRLSDSDIIADDVAISLGASDLGGRIAWSYGGQPELFTVTIRSNSIDIAEIATILPPVNADAASTDPVAEEARGEIALPPVDFDLEISAIHADRLDIQDLSIGARLREGLIDEARVSLTVEDAVQLQGGLDLDARQLPARGRMKFNAENLDIGRVLRRMELVDDLRMRADTLDLLVTMQGSTPRQFALSTLLQADLLEFNWQIPRTSTADESGAAEYFEVNLGEVQLATSPDQPTTWTSSGHLDGVRAELFMRAPHLNDLFGERKELPVTLIAAADNNVAMIDARIDRSTQDRLSARVMMSGQVIAGENRDLSELVSPLEDYQLQSDVILDDMSLQLADVQMRLGSSSAEGRVDVDTSGSRTRFDVQLHAPYLQTDDLLYWSTDFREAIVTNDESADEDAGPDEEDALEPVEPAEKRGVLFLANDFIAEFREQNDLGISITVDELRSGPALLGGGEVRLNVDADEFRLAPLTFSLPGGGVDAEYWAKTENGRVDAGLSVNADAFSYGGLLRLADHESEARGLLFLDAQIQANTEMRPGAFPLDLLLRNANGAISIAAWPENFESGVLDLWTANLILAVLPTPESGEASRLNCLVTRFDIEDGLMKSRTTLLDTTETIIRGRGTIDLDSEVLDLLIWPQAKREKFFSASTPVAITGSFDEFEIGVAPAGFLGTLIKWYTSLIYVPFKWLTGERFPPDGTSTCFDAMDWELTPELQEYFLQRDFSTPPVFE